MRQSRPLPDWQAEQRAAEVDAYRRAREAARRAARHVDEREPDDSDADPDRRTDE